jgi:hypothetical protein
VIGTKVIHRVLQMLPADESMEMAHLLAKHTAQDLTLYKHSEAFVQPEVFPTHMSKTIETMMLACVCRQA